MAAVPASVDIIIAGGGMVGASLALQLSHHSQQRLNILIVERFKAPSAEGGGAAPVYSTSFDSRSTALSYGSRLILEPLGVWDALQAHLSSIDTIHVSERGQWASAVMQSSDVAWPALGYVVENAWLGNVLLNQLQRQHNVYFHSPASVESIQAMPSGVECEIRSEGETHSVSAQLVVVADGANSAMRDQLGIDTRVHDYRQSALIANVCFKQAHQGCAYERFTDQGPLALLPLTNSERGEARSALVWTMDDEMLATLEHCDEATFLTALQARFGHRLGEFTRVGERVSFPLKLVEACEQVRSGVVIMGNAAHSLHPVAGQGFNLALRDCARLTQLLVEALQAKQPLGRLATLQRYEQQQGFDQQKTLQFSDYLPRMFTSQQWPLTMARTLGLATVDVLPALKAPFIRHSAGLHDGAALGS